MKIKLIGLLLLLSALTTHFTLYGQDKTVLNKEGALAYQNYCAGCHGKQLEGAAAPALVVKELKHGADRKSIAHSISNGIPGTEMMKWSGVISDKQIGAVTDYILTVRQTPELAKVKNGKPLEINTKDYKLKIEQLITKGIERPWGLTFVDSRRALITGNKGELRWMIDGKLDTQKVVGIP